ncbi:hypothetical protein [Arthrobacter gengyunqii]|uniref:Uncharacterized protein n=1 Tax=Arthrobacter gengyunqii TaxID=2886940 RepID=A0ABS8GFW5_9MICC|nr:hypothetical protein [Arthrobacter gengyunqii]MCC3265295.1 hypothetical protein [Arthrobacter gengyunqii]
MNTEQSNAAASQTGTTQASPQVILLNMLRVMDELVQLQGGEWTYEDDALFDPTSTAGYWGMTTCGDDINRQYSSTVITGPGVSSPEDAATRAAEHLEAQGFTETNKFESSIENNRYIVQTLSHPDGTSVVYHPGTGHSSINVHSACSSDPGMDMRTL